MKPKDMGTFFDSLTDRGSPTRVHLARPFDIAPSSGVTYGIADLARLVREAAGWIAAAGAGRGDRVAIVKDNHWDYELLACAAVRVGATPTLIDHGIAAETLQIMLKRLEPAVLITTTRMLRTASEAGVDLAGAARRSLCLDGESAGAIALDDVRGASAPPPQRRHDSAPLVITATSGTTGTPKLVVHSTKTIIDRLASFEAVRWPILGYRRDDTVCTAGAFAHGRMFCWTASVFSLRPEKVVIATDTRPVAAEPVLREHRPTTLEAPPSAFVNWQEMAAEANNPFGNVRLFMSTYDAMHPPTIRALLAASQRRRPVWLQGWGQSETGPLTFRMLTRNALAATRRHPTTRNLGWPVPVKTQVRVVDPRTFRPVANGFPGVLVVRTKARCLTYVGEPERWSAKAYGSWWNTGDIGVRTSDGSVQLLDREIDNIPGTSCLELEDVIAERLTDVAECVILGVPDRLPLPVVVTRTGHVDAAQWRRAVADLPELAEPLFLDPGEVPRTATGKVRRLELREWLGNTVDTHGTGKWT